MLFLDPESDFLRPLDFPVLELKSLLDLDSVFFEVTFNLKDYLILPKTPDLDMFCKSLFGLGVEFYGFPICKF